MYRDDTAGKKRNPPGSFLPLKEEGEREGLKNWKTKRRGLHAGKHGECRSPQKRTSTVASEIKRFMVVSDALSLGSTYHGTLTAYPFPSLFLLRCTFSTPPPFSLCRATLPSRTLDSDKSYFAAKIVECAFQLKGGDSTSRGFTREQNARCQNKSGYVEPLRFLQGSRQIEVWERALSFFVSRLYAVPAALSRSILELKTASHTARSIFRHRCLTCVCAIFINWVGSTDSVVYNAMCVVLISKSTLWNTKYFYWQKYILIY